jgi:two-component system, OmpR family, sensor histidine kinase BaeS
VGVVAPRAKARGVTIETAFKPAPSVEGDAARLGQVVRNLLENAVTHTPEGGRIQVSVEAEGEAVRLVVRDTGPGVREEHLPLIFERFYRADPSRTRATGGAGLGLAIVKQLVEAHGGTVEGANAPGGGAAFTVELPALRVAPGAFGLQPGRRAPKPS